MKGQIWELAFSMRDRRVYRREIDLFFPRPNPLFFRVKRLERERLLEEKLDRTFNK